MQSHIIIVDTEPGHPIGTQIREYLKDARHYQEELQATPLADAETKGASHPQLLIPVLSARTSQATQLLASCHQAAPHISMLPVATAPQLPLLINRFGQHLVDFLIPPFDANEVLARVENSLARRHRQLRVPSPKAEPGALAGLITEDPAFTRIKQQLPRMAQFEAPVLITGESGTGKELCARALHYLSPRASRPFLPVNCGALPETLFARELFGHHKGAFTGADTTQAGLVAEAEGGTLFLDEISTLNLPSQAMLLRFLQDQTYFAIGSPRPQQASVWIIAATNVDLADKVKDGTFRSDLFYRLAVMPLVLPPCGSAPGISRCWPRRLAPNMPRNTGKRRPRGHRRRSTPCANTTGLGMCGNCRMSCSRHFSDMRGQPSSSTTSRFPNRSTCLRPAACRCKRPKPG